MAYRDSNSDSGRLGGPSSSRYGENVARDFGPTSIAEQNAAGGYNKTDVPEGGTPPRSKYTFGSRGMDDMMDMQEMQGMGPEMEMD